MGLVIIEKLRVDHQPCSIYCGAAIARAWTRTRFSYSNLFWLQSGDIYQKSLPWRRTFRPNLTSKLCKLPLVLDLWCLVHSTSPGCPKESVWWWLLDASLSLRLIAIDIQCPMDKHSDGRVAARTCILVDLLDSRPWRSFGDCTDHLPTASPSFPEWRTPMSSN